MRIVITVYKNSILSMGFEDGKVSYVDVCPRDNDIVGSVYVGMVSEVKKNLDACFVRISPGIKGFLRSGDCPDGKLPKSGELIAVRVKSGAVKTKPVSLTMKIKKELIEKGSSRTVYSCLEKGVPAYIKHIKKLPINVNIEEIVTDDKEVYESFRIHSEGKDEAGLRFYEDDIPLKVLYSLDARLDELLGARVWLSSGAYLIIEHTEALNVIDVNSGKSPGRKDRSEYLHRVNTEAAREAARQIRLRNLSGIILIDFISYEPQDSHLRNELIKELEEGLKADPSGAVFVDMTALDIAEITRRRGRPPLYEILRDH